MSNALLVERAQLPERPYYALCTEQGQSDRHIRLEWRADASSRRSWATADRDRDDERLVCELSEWR